MVVELGLPPPRCTYATKPQTNPEVFLFRSVFSWLGSQLPSTLQPTHQRGKGPGWTEQMGIAGTSLPTVPPRAGATLAVRDTRRKPPRALLLLSTRAMPL